MNSKELQALRVLIDRKVREKMLLPVAQVEYWHGTEYGYGEKKCRCSKCRYGSTQARAARRNKQMEREPEKLRMKERDRQRRYRASMTPEQKARNLARRREWERTKRKPRVLLTEKEKKERRRVRQVIEWRKNSARINAKRKERRDANLSEHNRKRRLKYAERNAKETV